MQFSGIPHARRARFPQRVAQTQFYLRFVPSTRAVSAEGRARTRANGILLSFRASDARDLWRGSPRTRTNEILSAFRAFDARNLRRGPRTQFHLHFAPWTRAISAEVLTFVVVCWAHPRLERIKKRDVKMWEDVRKCEMWEDVRRYQLWEDVGRCGKILNLFTPSFWRTLRSDALGKKKRNL